MPHQCVHCGEVYPDAAEELLKGCSCGARFFYYIKQEKADQIEKGIKEKIEILEKSDKDQIEKDIREMTGITEEDDKPVILDLESVKVIKPGKFEIDIINLFSKRRPLIYKLEEGKYIIDLAATLKADTDEINRKIKNPDLLNIEEREKKKEGTEKEDKENKDN